MLFCWSYISSYVENIKVWGNKLCTNQVLLSQYQQFRPASYNPIHVSFMLPLCFASLKSFWRNSTYPLGSKILWWKKRLPDSYPSLLGHYPAHRTSSDPLAYLWSLSQRRILRSGPFARDQDGVILLRKKKDGLALLLTRVSANISFLLCVTLPMAELLVQAHGSGQIAKLMVLEWLQRSFLWSIAACADAQFSTL